MKKVFLLFCVIFLLGAAYGKDVTVLYNFPMESGITDVAETVTITEDANAFSAFIAVANQKSLGLDLQFFDFDGDGLKEAAFVNGVDGIRTSDDFSSYWQFSVNNAPAIVGISDYTPLDSDTVSLDYKEGKIEDAIEWLSDRQKENGEIGSNDFQSAFALMALGTSADSNVVLPQAVIAKAQDYFIEKQESDASFGDGLQTALAVIALISTGRKLESFSVSGKTSIEKLAETQQGDGGFKSGTPSSDVDTTSWVIVAFSQAGEELPEKQGNSPIDYLLSVQQPGGSFGYNAYDSAGSVDFTEEAIIALAAAKHARDEAIENAIAWLSLQQDEEGCIVDGFRTALGGIAFSEWNETEKAEKTIECLNGLQNGDGSFGRKTNKSNAVDTAISVIALSGKTFPLSSDENWGSGSNDGFAGLNSVAKFIVEIENTGNVKAQNVKVALEGIPSSWVYSSSEGSIDFFESVLPGEKVVAEIFARLEGAGTFSVKAIVSSDTMLNEIESNKVELKVEEAALNAKLSLGS